MQLLYLIVTALLGGFLQASTGFGFAVFTMALWPLVLSVPEATILEMIAAMVGILYIFIRLRRHINYRLLTLPAIICSIVSIVGLQVQFAAPEAVIRKVLGGVLLLLSVYFFRYSTRITIHATWKSAVLTGLGSGIMSGLCNISGPPIVLYYSVACAKKEEYSATLQAFFICTLTTKLIFALGQGMVTEQVKGFLLPVAVATVVGSALGMLLFHRVSTDKIRKAVYGIMACAGLFYLLG